MTLLLVFWSLRSRHDHLLMARSNEMCHDHLSMDITDKNTDCLSMRITTCESVISIAMGETSDVADKVGIQART